METTNNTRKDRWFKPVFDIRCDISSKKSRMECEESLDSSDKITSARIPTHAVETKNVEVEMTLEQFSPQEVSELAVHTKKVQEVADWLTNALKNPTSGGMLLLTGPSGCGKTATVQLLARQIGVAISEWVTPLDVEFEREFGGNSYTFQEKQSDKFKDFLLKSSFYTSLLRGPNSRRITLVEDFPNIFVKDSSEFFNILQIYKERGKSPLIFICTDTRDGGINMSWNLFPANIQEKYAIDQISFNPISATLMKQALKRAISLIQKANSSFKAPEQDYIESIINSSMGDIRSAINNLQFASGEGNKMAKTQFIAKGPKGKKTNKSKDKKQSKLTSIGKDETLTVMHGVGRVLNPKLTEKLTAKDHQRFTHSPDSIVDSFLMQPHSFVSYIHENYLPHFSNIHYVESAAHTLSDADCFMNEWREKFGKIYGMTVAVSGLMIANKAPVSSWHPIKGPKKRKYYISNYARYTGVRQKSTDMWKSASNRF